MTLAHCLLHGATESMPQLQHTVRSLAEEDAPARVPQLLVLVVSLAVTGHGEAFVRLKVLPGHAWTALTCAARRQPMKDMHTRLIAPIGASKQENIVPGAAKGIALQALITSNARACQTSLLSRIRLERSARASPSARWRPSLIWRPAQCCS